MLKKLKNVFFEEDENKDNPKKVETKTHFTSFDRNYPDPALKGNNTTQPNTFGSIVNDITQSAIASTQVEVDAANSEEYKKFITHISGILNQINSDSGPNINTFLSMIEKMGNNISEENKFSAAYAALSALGLNKLKLLNSAEMLISIVDKDKSEFTEYINQNISTNEIEVNKVSSTITNNLSKIEEVKRQTQLAIEKLQNEMKNEIERLQSENSILESKTSPIQQETEKLKAKLLIYNKASNDVRQGINTNIEKVNKYIN